MKVKNHPSKTIGCLKKRARLSKGFNGDAMFRWLSEVSHNVSRFVAQVPSWSTGSMPLQLPNALIKGTSLEPPRAEWQLSRPVLLLAPSGGESRAADEQQRAWEAIHKTMARIDIPHLVVWGRKWAADPDGPSQQGLPVEVTLRPFWIDRFLVSNRQYAEFVQDGGYRRPEFWHEQVREVTCEFMDQTGRPGPRYWEDGKYHPDLADHPVVGISWFEASAYAAWAGKRLPTDAEWLAASRGPLTRDSLAHATGSAGFAEGWQHLADTTLYPWGDLFDPHRANLWETGIGTTVPVDAFSEGDSPAGVRQLIGNVWEWTSSVFGQYDTGADFVWTPFWISVRGGAYDTYFSLQGSRLFQSGERPLARRPNIGFRCAWSGPEGSTPPEG